MPPKVIQKKRISKAICKGFEVEENRQVVETPEEINIPKKDVKVKEDSAGQKRFRGRAKGVVV